MKQLKMWSFVLAVSAAVVLFAAPMPAQVFGEFDDINPIVKMGYSIIPAGNVSGLGGTFGSSSVNLGFGIPVGGDLSPSSRKTSGYRLLVNGVGSRSASDLTGLARAEVFYDIRAGVTGLYLAESRDAYRLSTLLGVSEDNSTMKKPRLRFTMSGNGTYHINSDLFLLYGIAVTYVYGDAKFLPLLGFRWEFVDQWSFGVVLPLSAGIMYRPGRDFSLRISVSPAGDKMGFENGNAFPGAGDIIAMKMTQAKLNADAKWRLSESLELRTAAGVLLSRNISFLDGKTVLQSGTVAPMGFVSVEVSFHLGESFFPEDLF